jgi:soluble lytic murein transglycosylase-like protein
MVRGVLLAVLLAPAASADVYSYTDADGVIHFTNLPRGKAPWKRLFKTGPGKASSRRGPCVACDAVPASDTSPERFSRFDAHIADAAGVYQIPEALIRAVIKVESDYDPRVVSNVGARGLMQLMPDTQSGMGVRDVFDPRECILGGTRYLRVLANRFDGDLVRTLAGYHAGPGAVDKYDGIPPYETTQAYVRAVLRHYYRYKRGRGPG